MLLWPDALEPENRNSREAVQQRTDQAERSTVATHLGDAGYKVSVAWVWTDHPRGHQKENNTRKSSRIETAGFPTVTEEGSNSRAMANKTRENQIYVPWEEHERLLSLYKTEMWSWVQQHSPASTKEICRSQKSISLGYLKGGRERQWGSHYKL